MTKWHLVLIKIPNSKMLNWILAAFLVVIIASATNHFWKSWFPNPLVTEQHIIIHHTDEPLPNKE